MIYIRWIHANLSVLSNSINKKFDQHTNSLNDVIKMMNDHTSVLKRLVPVEKLLPSLDRKVNQVERETQRNSKILNSKLNEH